MCCWCSRLCLFSSGFDVTLCISADGPIRPLLTFLLHVLVYVFLLKILLNFQFDTNYMLFVCHFLWMKFTAIYKLLFSHNHGNYGARFYSILLLSLPYCFQYFLGKQAKYITTYYTFVGTYGHILISQQIRKFYPLPTFPVKELSTLFVHFWTMT